MSKVFVGGLSFSTTEDGLRRRFEEFGEVVSAIVIMDRETGRSKGFGFVEYTDPKSAESAVEAMKAGEELDGRTIRVDIANARPPRGEGGFRSGGGGYGGGGDRFGGSRREFGGGDRGGDRGGYRSYDRGSDDRSYDRDRRDYGSSGRDRRESKPYDRPSGDRKRYDD
nr:hypothetical protein HK105_003038 [Polyrhizophydium stewartii]